jgi:TnpA family transposase
VAWILHLFATDPRQNGLAVALRELGRIEQTLFTLEWLESTELRRRVQAGLNKGEAKNALARAVFFNLTAWVKCVTAASKTNAIGPAV